MRHTKFVVRLTRPGTQCAQYVQRIDRKNLQTTIQRKLALLMGRVTAMEVLKSLEKSRWIPELVAVQVGGEHQFAPTDLVVPDAAPLLSV